jgi:hypothetical protein
MEELRGRRLGLPLLVYSGGGVSPAARLCPISLCHSCVDRRCEVRFYPGSKRFGPRLDLFFCGLAHYPIGNKV